MAGHSAKQTLYIYGGGYVIKVRADFRGWTRLGFESRFLW